MFNETNGLNLDTDGNEVAVADFMIQTGCAQLLDENLSGNKTF